MTKPNEDMDVVEIDAIDHGDWETNMSTSELSVAGLAALVRQTAAAPVADRPPQTRIGPTAARPAVSVHTPVPVKAPPIQAPAPEPVDVAVERAPAPRRSSRRMLLIAAGASGVLGIVVGVIMVLGSSGQPTEVTATTPASAPATALAAPAPARPAIAKPAIAATTPRTDASAPPRHAVHDRARDNATQPPASHATAVHHSRAPSAKKRVAMRTQAPAAPPVAADVLDRAHTAYSTGNEALFAGDTDAAIRSYQEVVGLSPTLAFGYRGLGLAYAQSGDTAAAIKALRRYLELAPHAKDVALIRKRLLGLQHSP